MEKKILIWDFDGVLLDSFDLDFEVTKVFTGITTKEQHYEMFCGNIHEWDVANGTRTHVDGKTLDEHINEKIFDCLLFPEMKEIVLEIAEHGVIQIIVSSAPDARIDTILAKNGLRGSFNDIYGSGVHKSKAAKFNMIKEKYNIELEKALFITDTLGDLREAEQVNLPSIGVSWGYHPNEHLERGNPIAIVHTAGELRKELSTRIL